ncbi:putative HTH-type transcriptional regulator YdcR [compost metagenome]
MECNTPPESAGFAYQAVYRYLVAWIEASPSAPERRLPSLRELAQRLRVSVSTTKYAYALLEDEGRIQARPRQGYFTCVSRPVIGNDGALDLLDRVFASARRPGMLALSSDAPALLRSMEQPLLMLERELTRQYPQSRAPLYQPFGEPELRAVLADRYTRSAHDCWHAEQVFVGSDLPGILPLALRALALEGQVALVESPCSWAVLRQLEAAGMTILEVPLGADGRFDLAQFHRLLCSAPVSLAVLSSATNVPQGGLMPAADKQQICRWLAERGVWLFENDSYGELCFDRAPARYRDHADPQRLVVFSTFDKLIGSEAPYGYLLCRQYTERLQVQFLARGFRLSPIRQKAIARLFRSRRIDQHLRRLRSDLSERMQHMQALLQAHCRDQLHIAPASGAACLWLEATRPVDMRRVFERLLGQGIVIAPGEIFSRQGLWRSHLRLSFTLDWSDDIALALQRLTNAIKGATYPP